MLQLGKEEDGEKDEVLPKVHPVRVKIKLYQSSQALNQVCKNRSN